MVYTADTATLQEVKRWADEIKETESYYLAYQGPSGAENAVDEDGEFDAEQREMLTLWEKSESGRLRSVTAVSGQKPEYRETFDMTQSDAGAESII